MVRISGTGCSLLDYICADVDFGSAVFDSYRSREAGDGGLEPGKLVFAEDFERFAGRPLEKALTELTGGREPDACNVGGPGVIALAHAAQLLGRGGDFQVDFAGAVGEDGAASRLLDMVAASGLDLSRYATKPGRTPFTMVLSDPRFEGGKGERSFINEIGAAQDFGPRDLPASFFDAEIVVFGGTGLTPTMHDALDGLLARARGKGSFTVVNTVYDFRNQRRDPVGRWPLGSGDEAYASVDLLVADLEEARRLSGADEASGALEFFRSRGVGAAVVTAGTREIRAAAWKGGRFAPLAESSWPVSAAILTELAGERGVVGDTTGCGDNFAGGLIASAAMQLAAGRSAPDLVEALAWATASGGFARFHFGGLYSESRPGEKRTLLEPYVEAWRRQVGILR
ncbi:MAG: carbohydrate kinase family protein [Treponema sp.]|nr:carbohydrate kinase family protein [Treponema sp.]